MTLRAQIVGELLSAAARVARGVHEDLVERTAAWLYTRDRARRVRGGETSLASWAQLGATAREPWLVLGHEAVRVAGESARGAVGALRRGSGK